MTRATRWPASPATASGPRSWPRRAALAASPASTASPSRSARALRRRGADARRAPAPGRLAPAVPRADAVLVAGAASRRADRGRARRSARPCADPLRRQAPCARLAPVDRTTPAGRSSGPSRPPSRAGAADARPPGDRLGADAARSARSTTGCSSSTESPAGVRRLVFEPEALRRRRDRSRPRASLAGAACVGRRLAACLRPARGRGARASSAPSRHGARHRRAGRRRPGSMLLAAALMLGEGLGERPPRTTLAAALGDVERRRPPVATGRLDDAEFMDACSPSCRTAAHLRVLREAVAA